MQFNFKYEASVIAKADALIFIFNGNQVYLYNNSIPTLFEVTKNSHAPTLDNLLYFGSIDTKQCFCLLTDADFHNAIATNFNLVILKTSYSILPKVLYEVAILANHLVFWWSNNLYCGACSQKTKFRLDELALKCTKCKHIIYPTIAPVVIGLIYNQDKVLLAQSKLSVANGFKWYGCISGFVNPGENLESALRREVNEEVGVEIDNIQYITSQPWPFPNCLMMGFTAQHVSGNIQIDNNEIIDAQWFDIKNLPQLPNPMSISRHLVEYYCNLLLK